MGINNTYSEEFRRNAVSVVRAGYATATIAKRLGMPETSLRNWLPNPRYADVQPASEEVLAQLPTESTGLVAITSKKTENCVVDYKKCVHAVIRSCNGLTIEFPEGLPVDHLVKILTAMKED